MPPPETLSYTHAILLGLLQGVTEFLPVSSSGHLALAQAFLGLETEELFSFDILLHVATALVVLRYFWNDIRDLAGVNRVVVGNLIIATIPAGVIGLTCRHTFEGIAASPLLVCLGLLTTAFFLWQAEQDTASRHSLRTLGSLNAAIIGLAQALAITPGISRSGMTVTGGIICGLSREDAFRFSFLMMVPVVLGAALVEAVSHRHELAGTFSGPMVAGFLAAFGAGWYSLRLLHRVILARRLRAFAVYCVVLAAVAAAWRLLA